MKMVSFATAPIASLVALMVVLVASAPVPAAAADLPGPNKKCNRKNMIAKDCVTNKPPTRKPTAPVVKKPATKPTRKPSKRPTRFPTVPPTTHRPSTSVPSAGPTSSPSDSPTASPSGSPTSDNPTTSPSGSPTSSPTAECPSVDAQVYSHDGHRYAHVQHAAPLTWSEAEAAAEDLACCGAQGHLVVVGDAAERDFVQDAVASAYGQYGWVGFNDVASAGTYVWTDGSPLDLSLFTLGSAGGNAAGGSRYGFYFAVGTSHWYTLTGVQYTFDYSIIEFDCSGPEAALNDNA
jgi:Lectin C-type domain